MHISRILGLALLAILVGACSNPQYILHPTSNPQMGETRQMVDEIMETTMLHPVRLGAYLAPTKGYYFQPVQPLDSRNAIIYVYRPYSRWSAEELQAPGFFLNGQFVYGLKGAGYFWVEVPAGTYTMVAKRPLTFVYLKTIFEVPVTVDGGKSYYFRYDEEDVAPAPKKGAELARNGLIRVGPLAQMPDDRGLREIEGAVLEEPGRTLALEPVPAWSPFELYADAVAVSRDNIEADQTPVAQGQPADLGREKRVWWNILTW